MLETSARTAWRSRVGRRIAVVVGIAVLLGLASFVTAGARPVAATTVAPGAVPQLAWIQWTAPGSYPNNASISSGGTYNYTYATQTVGTIAVPGGSTVYVKFTGEILGYPGASGFGISGDSYWRTSSGVGIAGAAYRSLNVPDLPSNSDRIGVSGSTSGGVQLQTLEFFSDSSRTIPATVTNLVMDIWSLGRPGVQGSWSFTQNFDILSDNRPPVSSYSGLTKTAGGPPFVLNGQEGAGTIQFNGSYSSVAWTVVNPEFYATWNIGVTTATAPSDPNITPSRSTITGAVGTEIAPVTFTDSGFVGAVTYAVKSGTLPAGLSLNPTTGEITGTPSGPGSATVVIEATGATSGVASASLDFSFSSSFTVTFDANGGSGSMSPQSSSTATNLTPNSYTRSGFTFAGWNTTPDGTGTAYPDGASYPFASSTTLYAQWAATPVVTTTVADSGSGGRSLPVTGIPFVTLVLAGLLVVAAGYFAFSVGFFRSSTLDVAPPGPSGERAVRPDGALSPPAPVESSPASIRVAELRARLRRLDGLPGEGVAAWRAELESELRALGATID